MFFFSAVLTKDTPPTIARVLVLPCCSFYCFPFLSTVSTHLSYTWKFVLDHVYQVSMIHFSFLFFFCLTSVLPHKLSTVFVSKVVFLHVLILSQDVWRTKNFCVEKSQASSERSRRRRRRRRWRWRREFQCPRPRGWWARAGEGGSSAAAISRTATTGMCATGLPGYLPGYLLDYDQNNQVWYPGIYSGVYSGTYRNMTQTTRFGTRVPTLGCTRAPTRT